LGVGLVYGLLLVFQPVVEQTFGLYIPIMALSGVEYGYVAATIAAGDAVGLVSAYRAYRNTLSDGLSMRL
jgi:putative ABC transport system permease protein